MRSDDDAWKVSPDSVWKPPDWEDWSAEGRRRYLKLVSNPMNFIERFKVKDKFGKPVDANFDTLDPLLRGNMETFLADVSDEEHERTGAKTQWVCEIKGRQSGRSTNYELGGLGLIMYRPGWLHVCLADTKPRADMLHGRMQYSYHKWPDKYRTPNITDKEMRQLTLNDRYGGQAINLSAQNTTAGIGMTPDSFHWSEVGYCPGFGETWRELAPSLLYRPNSKVVFECVPTEAGSEWHQFYMDAKQDPDNRFVARFTPWGAMRVAQARWDKTWTPDIEELRLLDRHQNDEFPLTLAHLAFRRGALSSVPEYRANPDLWWQHYPVDDLSCWVMKGAGAIPADALEWHVAQEMTEWRKGYDTRKVFRPWNPARTYVIGGDPSGITGADHGSFHVVCANPGDIHQAMVFSTNTTPTQMATALIEASIEYGDATIYIENNGPGLATIVLIQQMGHGHRLWYNQPGKPGWNNNPSTYNQALGMLLRLLREKDIRLFDKDTVHQLQTYGHDKVVEDSVRTRLTAARTGHRSKKKNRHHWDKVSALLSCMFGLMHVNAPSVHPIVIATPQEVPWREMPADEKVSIVRSRAYRRGRLRDRYTPRVLR